MTRACAFCDSLIPVEQSVGQLMVGFTLIFALCAVLAGVLPALGHTQAQGGHGDALAAARAGDLDSAVELWTRALKKDPKSYTAYVNRGTARLLTGHVFKGVEDWHAAVRYMPVFAFGVYRTDFVEEADGNRAVLNFAKSLEIDPDHVPSIMMMAAAYLDLGKDRMVADLFRKSIDLTRNPLLKNMLFHWAKSLEAGRRR